jgi:DNA-binding MarR family transcriptional regulator
MTATVKELLDAGYLVVTPDPGDGRKKILELTARGRDVLDADRRQRVSILAEAFRANLSEDERRVVAHALTLIERVTPTLAAQGQSSALDRGLITGAW